MSHCVQSRFKMQKQKGARHKPPLRYDAPSRCFLYRVLLPAILMTAAYSTPAIGQTNHDRPASSAMDGENVIYR